MKPSALAVTASICVAGTAWGGGLLLPGAGSISTSRAGAAVASADDGEALALNPAGIAKAKGTTITFSITAIDYFMQFTRNGTYDPATEEALPYAGQPYPTVKNDPSPPLGIGAVQPVPVVAVISDLGGAVKGLHVAAGIYAPNAYPFRDMATCPSGQPCYHYAFNTDFNLAPAPTRYDIVKQEAAIILPSVAAAYSVLPQLDVGVRLSLGFATLKSTTTVWANPANFEEYVKSDGQFTVDAKDSFVPEAAIGVAWRPTPELEFGARYTSELDIHAKGTASSINGPAASLGGIPPEVIPSPIPRCAPGGVDASNLKACVGLALPRTATVGGRYKFVDGSGAMRGDIELDVDWENWGKTCAPTDTNCVSPTDYKVTVDGVVTTAGHEDQGIPLKDSIVSHGLRDTFGIRIGASYVIPMSDNALILRGGIGYDTAAAKTHWERADVDGAARTTLAAGGSYRTKKFDISAGFGLILEGTRTDPRNCNPPDASTGCAPDGTVNPVDKRQGPDPIFPIIDSSQQFENPVNQGTYSSHYLLFMLGVTTWF